MRTLAGTAVLWAVPLAFLALAAENPSPLQRFGQVWVWLAWLAAGAGALWYVRQVSARNVVHVLAGFGLGLGVLAACGASRWDASGNWLAYHVLTVAWILIALALLIAGWTITGIEDGRSRIEDREHSQSSSLLDPRSSILDFRRFAVSLFPSSTQPVVAWLEAFGILILALA